MKGPLRRLVWRSTLLVAVVAVVVTAMAALPLLQAVDASDARAAVATQADRLAAATPEVRGAAVTGSSALGDPTQLVALVDAAGTARGPASSLVDASVRARLAAGTGVSITVRHDRTAWAVEARPLSGGGAVVVAQDLGRVRSLSFEVFARVGVALVIGFAVAAGVAAFASRRLTRPLAGLAAAARGIAGGRRDVAFSSSPIDEIRDVEIALETVSTALARSEARQREFLLSVSHELRTPLTAIRGYSSALRDGLIPPERVGDVGRTMDAEAARLSVFTDDLLALARLEAEDFPLEPGPVDVAGLLAEARAGWGEAARAADIDVVVTAPIKDPDAGRTASALLIVTDRRRVRQVLDGLIENALRVSEGGTAIRLDARREGDEVVLEVSDSGPGLSPDDLARAFERGVLRDRYREARRVGSGLGLSIAARLTERLGARISAHPGDGAGTVFRIAFPDQGDAGL